jgi:putative transposase
MVYHVLNRGNGRQAIFHKPEDYAACLRVLKEAQQRYPVRLFCLCLMPNHWHLVVRPQTDAALGDFMRWIGVTHVRRHHEHYHVRGAGHLYQGRFKSFIVEEDLHFLRLCRYVEANALRAKLVQRAEEWPWCSAAAKRGEDWPVLSDWPVDRPARWLAMVNRAMDRAMLEQVRTSVVKGRPLGDARWQERMVKRLGLEHTMRPPGRPPKSPGASEAAGRNKRHVGDRGGGK